MHTYSSSPALGGILYAQGRRLFEQMGRRSRYISICMHTPDRTRTQMCIHSRASTLFTSCFSRSVYLERQLRLLFEQAYKMQPSIIFFDEIDGTRKQHSLATFMRTFLFVTETMQLHLCMYIVSYSGLAPVRSSRQDQIHSSIGQ